MGALGVALIVTGSFIAGLTMDMGVNALQNWYDVMYQDAFWSAHPVDTPTMRALAREEHEIDLLLNQHDFVTEREARTDVPSVHGALVAKPR